MSIVQAVTQLIRDWSIDIYAGWSIMDLFGLGVVLVAVILIIQYFFEKAGS